MAAHELGNVPLASDGFLGPKEWGFSGIRVSGLDHSVLNYIDNGSDAWISRLPFLNFSRPQSTPNVDLTAS